MIFKQGYSFSNWVCFLLTLVWMGGVAGAPRVFADWPQAAGPNGNYRVSGTTLKQFSVARNQGVRWRVSLPNTGESAPIVSRGKVFVTCHTPMKADGESGKDILGICFDAQSGKELWRRQLPGSRETDMASGFSDNTAASPVADGERVCFVNVGGSIRTYDYEGRLLWKHDWVPFGRHHARQQEPILHNGKVLVLKTVAKDLPLRATTKAGAKILGRDEKYWTRLHAFDIASGKIQWVAESATSVHAASQWGRTAKGKAAVLTGRGGGHQPPEEPYGLSLIDAENGKTIWDLAVQGYSSHENNVWDGRRGCCFVGMKHHELDMLRGKLSAGVSLENDVTICSRSGNGYVITTGRLELAKKRKRPITYHTNCLVGNYHYFRAHQQHLIGRVNLATQTVEYLQVPVQVDRRRPKDVLLWDKTLKNDVRNSDGFVVYQDKRATLSGWGHVSAASPLVVGDYLYMPTMVGTVYVLNWKADQLDESALVSISDLGISGETWSLSSLAYSDGKIFARTMKELICLEPVSKPAVKLPLQK